MPDSRTAVETVSAWFDAFARGDLDAARSLFAPDGVTYVFTASETVELRGFDEFVVLYGRRRESLGESFEYRVVELLGGERDAAALITLARDEGGRRIEWRQLAAYRVDDGVISELRGYEELEASDGGW